MRRVHGPARGSISDCVLFRLAAFITVCLHTLAKVSGGCRSDGGGPKAWAQINLLFNLIMRFGVGCLSPINTTVIAFEEEWAQATHEGTLTLACTPKHGRSKSNCMTQAHTGTRTGERIRSRRTPRRREEINPQRRKVGFPGEFNSVSRCERMCVHVYMVLHVLNHGVLLINMVISKQRGVLRIAAYY